jgi:hypothetical protein
MPDDKAPEPKGHWECPKGWFVRVTNYGGLTPLLASCIPIESSSSESRGLGMAVTEEPLGTAI